MAYGGKLNGKRDNIKAFKCACDTRVATLIRCESAGAMEAEGVWESGIME